MSAVRPLSVAKLTSGEDEGLHEMLDQLATADSIARELVIQGAFKKDAARLKQWLGRVAGELPGDIPDEEADRWYPTIGKREDWTYLIGVAVGLRLARMDAGPQAGGSTGKR